MCITNGWVGEARAKCRLLFSNAVSGECAWPLKLSSPLTNAKRTVNDSAYLHVRLEKGALGRCQHHQPSVEELHD
jgi:hypothetical protein